MNEKQLNEFYNESKEILSKIENTINDNTTGSGEDEGVYISFSDMYNALKEFSSISLIISIFAGIPYSIHLGNGKLEIFIKKAIARILVDRELANLSVDM